MFPLEVCDNMCMHMSQRKRLALSYKSIITPR